jgi:hypothetical protein
MNDKSDVLDYLAMNKDHYKDLLFDDFVSLNDMLQDESLKLFWDDIRDQFEMNARYIIITDLLPKFDIETVDLWILVEDINIKEYLK